LTQTFGGWHCELTVQLTPQLAPAHRNGAQLDANPAVQLPVPLQVLAPVSVAPLQLPAAHTVPEAYLRHAPAPSHCPSLPQLAAPWSEQSPSGSMPFETGAQVPSVESVSDAVQLWHAPVHAELQHTPSTQKPLWHSFAWLA
jgi:hypothetical protein